MIAKNKQSVSANRSAKWDHMIDQLSNNPAIMPLLQEHTRAYVEAFLLNHQAIGASTFHYANSSK